ncbi:LytTR family DNA-binding domain-containing protein [Marivita sp.]|uniref:LytTR family DNA-binding domain-containing protein n=1 Tax=Marivita sp. TaxID=2003365 RepID=UPI003F71E5D4
MSFCIAQFFRELGRKRTLVYMMLSLMVFYAADPSGARNYVPLWFSLILWPVAFVFYLIVYHSQFLIMAAASRRLPRLRVPTALLGLIALLPTVVCCQVSVTYISDGSYPRDVMSELIFYFLTVQGLETVFYRFIMPGVRDEIEAESPARHLVVGGEKIDLSTLLHIEAREHHVHLTFANAKSLIRARLGDIVAQTKAEDGIQPHRSWWVAKDPSIKAERKDGRMILRLRDDTEVPVARTRINDVLHWLQDHINPIR